jgi:hypothetical protein
MLAVGPTAAALMLAQNPASSTSARVLIFIEALRVFVI